MSSRANWLRFISATTGTPPLLRDSDISTEMPADVDDENLGPQGFSPTLPGELTKISSALALFRVAKILSKVLEDLYPAKATYHLSLTKLHALSDELDQWSEELPDHLRLRFCNDKPSTHMISCRSPLLVCSPPTSATSVFPSNLSQSLAYFYTRSLIHRPLLCHGSDSNASAAGIVLAAAGKHILQILDLLLERHMNYTFPLNKVDLLLTSGFAIVWQSLDLEDDSKLIKDNQKSLTSIIGMLQLENPAAAAEFQKVVTCFVTVETRSVSPRSSVDITAPKPRSSMPSPADPKSKSARKQLQAIASRWSTFGSKAKAEDVPRRATVPASLGPVHRAASTASLSSTRSAPVMQLNNMSSNQLTTCRTHDSSAINLDYLALGDDFGDSQTRTSSSTMLPPKKQPTPPLADAGWDQLFNGIDQNPTLYQDLTSTSGHGLYQVPSNEWTSDSWHLSPLEFTTKAPVPQSLLSFSDESLTSGDDFMFSATGSHTGSTVIGEGLDLGETYRGITIPVDDEFDFHEIEA